MTPIEIKQLIETCKKRLEMYEKPDGKPQLKEYYNIQEQIEILQKKLKTSELRYNK